MSFQNCKIVCQSADPKQYHKQEAARGSPDYVMSSGSLRVFGQCPSRFVAGYEPPDSEAKKWGDMIDCLHLTPEQWDKRYATPPETYRDKKGEEKPWRNDKRIAEVAAWIDAHAGREFVKQDEVDRVRRAVRLLERDDTLRAWRAACDVQVWVAGEWQDEASGLSVPVRCLLDYAPRKDSEFAACLGDLKTTRNAALRPWTRWCWQAGYHIQAAWNTDLYIAATGEDRNTFCFVLQENFEPYQTAKRMLSQDFLALGRETYQRLIAGYCACLKAGQWPDYDAHDEAVQSWSLVAPEPWMQSDALFAPRFNFEDPDGDTAEPVPDVIP